MSAFPDTPKTLLSRMAAQVTGESEASWVRFFDLYQPVIRKFAEYVGAKLCRRFGSNGAWMIGAVSPRYRVKTCRPNAWGFYDRAGLCWERLADTVPPLKNGMHAWSEEGKALFVNQYVQHANGQEVDPVMAYDGKGGLSVSVSCNGGCQPVAKVGQ